MANNNDFSKFEKAIVNLKVNEVININVNEVSGKTSTIGIEHHCPFNGAHIYIINPYNDETNCVIQHKEEGMTIETIAKILIKGLENILYETTNTDYTLSFEDDENELIFNTKYGIIKCVSQYDTDSGIEFFEMYNEEDGYCGTIYPNTSLDLNEQVIEEQIYENICC